MNLAVIFIIFSMFSTVFDGGELCFSSDGEVHLSCCCKKETTLKKPCCGSHCTNVSFPSLDVASNQLKVETDAEIDSNVSQGLRTSGLAFNLKPFRCYVHHPSSGDRSYLSLKLSKAVLRC